MSTGETNGKVSAVASEEVTTAVSCTMLSENVHISSHPVLSHKITILRSSSTSAPTFRSLLREVTYHLGYEATSSLTTRPMKISVPTPLGLDDNDHLEHTGSRIQERVALIPILRSGLGLVDAMLELLPNADVHHIGMYKSHRDSNHVPIQYYNRLPRMCESDIAYVLDPVIGTASTVLSVIGILKKVRFYSGCIRKERVLICSSSLTRVSFHYSILVVVCSGVSQRFTSFRWLAVVTVSKR
jgi:uracil phosphoribosyltransferase